MLGWFLGLAWLVGRRNRGAKAGALVQAIAEHELRTGKRVSRREMRRLRKRAKRLKV